MITIAVKSARIQLGLRITVALALCVWAAEGRAYTFEQQQACMGDAFRLCSSEIPYVERVKACMIRLQSQLSPGCRVYFRPEPDSAAAGSLSVKPAHIRRWHKPKKPSQHDDT